MTTTTPPATAAKPPSLFDRIGGEAGARLLADRFYDLMEQQPEYAELRAMHAPDLAPMRVSLTQFLSAWLGGPRTWFEERPGACIMSAHRSMDVSRETARQWLHAMSRAMVETAVEPDLGQQMQQAMTRMGSAMIVR
ncbi:group II truncated hemoglobin [Sphingomonas abietis]|uniref:Group II truncated hemoglobin n=1 Tax=Sphingomonas abietis TaxID=3012344 RepID=A0ABY7NHV8_9SPHN|nr:group II truncated hemoglobin [Sphingomonas abietis]WBO21098.1 group II truncated hemoglobin [Sphingomonas abietis]